MSPQQTSRLFTIPREVRNKIYKYCLEVDSEPFSGFATPRFPRNVVQPRDRDANEDTDVNSNREEQYEPITQAFIDIASKSSVHALAYTCQQAHDEYLDEYRFNTGRQPFLAIALAPDASRILPHKVANLDDAPISLPRNIQRIRIHFQGSCWNSMHHIQTCLRRCTEMSQLELIMCSSVMSKHIFVELLMQECRKPGVGTKLRRIAIKWNDSGDESVIKRGSVRRPWNLEDVMKKLKWLGRREEHERSLAYIKGLMAVARELRGAL